MEVRVELKPGVVDAEGMAARRALGLLGIADVESVRIARTYDLTFQGVDGREALRRAQEAVERLLANPVIHSVTLGLKEGSRRSPPTRVTPVPRRGRK